MSNTIPYPQFVYEVEKRRCRGCQRCISVCPTQAIQPFLSLRLRIVQINPSSCAKCGKCVDTCPFGAIVKIRK